MTLWQVLFALFLSWISARLIWLLLADLLVDMFRPRAVQPEARKDHQ